MKKISVIAWPAFSNKKINPYNYILYNNIKNNNIYVEEYKKELLFKLKNYDVLHLHWPESILNVTSPFHAIKNILFLKALLLWLKLNKTKTVWTVHNLTPHENRFPFLAKIFYNTLFHNIDAFIFLTKYSLNEITNIHKNITSKSYFIPHPHYKKYYVNECNKTEARKKLNIENDKFVFLFIGQVRAYKNVTGLVSAFLSMNCNESRLIIAGKIHKDVKEELQLLVSGKENILMFPEFIGDEKLHYFLNASDLVVNPFSKILNSGSVFLNLSFAKPTLAAYSGGLAELQDNVGKPWIKLYNGNINANILKKTKTEIQLLNSTSELPDLSIYDPEKVSTDPSDIYRTITHFD